MPSFSLRSSVLAAGTGVLALVVAGGVYGIAKGSFEPESQAGGTSTEITDEMITTDPPVSADDERIDDPSTWVIADGAIGPVRVGADYDGILDTLPAGWQQDEQCDALASWGDGDRPFDVVFLRGDTAPVIESVSVSGVMGEPSGGPRTPEGLGIGSTRDEVKATYPSIEEISVDGGDSFYLRTPVDAKGGSVYFQFASGDDRVVAITLTTGERPSGGPCSEDHGVR